MDEILERLKSKDQSARLEAARDLRRHVEQLNNEISVNAQGRVLVEKVNKRLFDLVRSRNTAEAWGGLVAITKLLDLEGEGKLNLFRYYNYVKALLPNDDVALMTEASKTLGKIVGSGGASFGERFMEKEVPAAVVMLSVDNQRFAGVLILKELAQHSATFFQTHLPLVLDSILLPLRDHRIAVRETAADLLAACLDVLSQRESTIREKHLSNILEDAGKGLKQLQPEAIHGSLLAYRELFRHGGMFMQDTYLDSAERIRACKSHKDVLIRKTVISLIPTLAEYDTQSFTSHLISQSMNHLLSELTNPEDHAEAFVAIGRTATAVRSDIKPYLEPIMHHIRTSLSSTSKKHPVPEAAVFQCIGLLAAAVGPHLTKLVQDILNLMFSRGLSESLVQALDDILHFIPPLVRPVQEHLLDLLSIVLSGQRYHPIGAPPTESPAPSVLVKKAQSTDLIKLALTTLGSFDFTGHPLNEIILVSVLPYLEHKAVEIRRASALTTSLLLAHDPICYQSSSHSLEVISSILTKLISAGVADLDPDVRLTVLKSLQSPFDKHLSQAENIQALFIALDDEVFENRLAAVNLVGRLARHNPAYILPSLRKALIQLLTELEYSTSQRSKEQCTQLLALLLSVTHRLIKPYALPMLRVLLQKAEDPNPVVSAHVLLCLGELASIVGEEGSKHIPELMQIVVPRITDAIPARQEAAIRALGQICSNMAYVIQPMLDYPDILDRLTGLLEGEPSAVVRREVLKVLGVLGAMDPLKFRNRRDEAGRNRPNQPTNGSSSNILTNPDDFFQDVVFKTLLRVFDDRNLSHYYPNVTEAIMSIFKTQGLRCSPVLPQIIPAFFKIMRLPGSRLGFYLEQLTVLVGIVKLHIRNHVHDICSLLSEFWDNTTFHLPIIALIESLGRVMRAEFKSCIPIVLPLLMKAFETDANMMIQSRILDTIAAFGSLMEDYLYLVLPAIIRCAECGDSTRSTIQTQKKAVQCLHDLSKQVNLSDHASRVILPLARLLTTKSNDLRVVIMETLSSFVRQLQSEYAIFVPTVQKCIEENQISHLQYQTLVDKLLGGEPLPHEDHAAPLLLPEYSAAAEPTAMSVNQQQLRSVWDTSSVRTSEDWAQWYHTVMIEFIKESPSHALRACMTLSDIYPPLARELFKPGFLSCWNDLTDDHQENLIRTIEHAMTSSKTPLDIVLSLLDLTEYMEHEGKTLPLEAKLLGDLAMNCSAYAKALHYKELEFLSDPSPNVIESLISINTRLQQHDAAWGTLVIARDRYDISKHEEWYERLGHWEEALIAYEARAKTDPNNFDATIGRMKCLHALGEWEELALKVNELWQHVEADTRREIAPMAAASAWALNSWDLVDTYSSAIRVTSPEKPFYRAILAVHRNQFSKALGQVSKARDLLSSEFKSISGEGYSRAYNSMVRVQMLSELEEILAYKQFADQPDRQISMQRMWMKRLEGCQPDVDVWQRILQVRRLVLNPQDDTSSWIKFANLSRRSGRMSLAEKTLNSLIPNNHHHKASPEVIYAQLKYMWADGKRNGSLQFLRQFTASLAKDVQSESGDSSSKVARPKLEEMTKLLARCYLKQGEWQVQLDDDWGTRDTEDILSCYHSATHFDPRWYKAWHTWAMANFDIVQYMEGQVSTPSSPGFGGGVVSHVVHAIDGFFRSIALRSEERLQDTLRLLTLYFKYGATLEVDRIMAQGIPSVDVETWLDVIPQLIARIHTPHASVRQNVNHVMTVIGRHHPQALVFPLAVATGSSSTPRRRAALSIMDRMREHSSKVVNEAITISQELLRVAILWTEMWHDGLEEASKLFFAEKNPDGMIATLEPLHKMLDAGPSTTDEAAFVQSYGKNLHEASEACRRWRIHDDGRELDKAWDLYYLVYVKTKKHIDKLSSLELQYVSPILLEVKTLDLAVPGTYRVGKPLVKITGFDPKLGVIKSKQHPRKLVIKGNDGKDYTYGLKGHEDLRQDERVMQFFGLVNSLLAVDPDSYKRRLHIQRYPVIPLAPNAGLMGWVQNSDTLHVLIQEYRHTKRVLINIEYRLMTQMAPDYEFLPLLNKIEVFEDALDHTRGQDLYRILWLKSSNSEHWLERRTSYTRSLAVNSMVGHILGLGDRHPSNLLIARATGKVVHIDFGDCFEVAMQREAYPERVPFRLTRMLVYAMEVSRIEGSFRRTCEISMTLLRENRESLLAVLEAFVYDPLINWRLMKAETDGRTEEATSHSFREVRVNPSDSSKMAPHPQGHIRKPKTDEKDIFNENPGQLGAQEVRNEKALSAYNRVQQKLTGRDFDPDAALPVEVQVEKLIQQATAVENLCQAFVFLRLPPRLSLTATFRTVKRVVNKTAMTAANEPRYPPQAHTAQLAPIAQQPRAEMRMSLDGRPNGPVGEVSQEEKQKEEPMRYRGGCIPCPDGSVCYIIPIPCCC